MSNGLLENISYVFVRLAKFFVKVAIFFVVIYLIGMQLFAFGHRLFYERSIDTGDGKEVIFEIKKGDTVDAIANNLEKAGLINDKFVFKFRSKIYKINFNPNVYNLKTSMTIKNMLDIFDNPTSNDILTTISSEEIYQLSPEDNDIAEVSNDGEE